MNFILKYSTTYLISPLRYLLDISNLSYPKLNSSSTPRTPPHQNLFLPQYYPTQWLRVPPFQLLRPKPLDSSLSVNQQIVLALFSNTFRKLFTSVTTVVEVNSLLPGSLQQTSIFPSSDTLQFHNSKAIHYLDNSLMTIENVPQGIIRRPCVASYFTEWKFIQCLTIPKWSSLSLPLILSFLLSLSTLAAAKTLLCLKYTQGFCGYSFFCLSRSSEILNIHGLILLFI